MKRNFYFITCSFFCRLANQYERLNYFYSQIHSQVSLFGFSNNSNKFQAILGIETKKIIFGINFLKKIIVLGYILISQLVIFIQNRLHAF